ncbi:putative nuclease HARBI1 [Amphibalanus amphitrite]|uniref:putative nuclease HARBI1 n=1 Tax=Amphibalanus amphitrite TaxID=1232801 RepID=UPI001C917296|nr:putative nuclease HARBI1 [Amphibalanus amphitrite]
MAGRRILLYDIRRAAGARRRHRETVDYFQLDDRSFYERYRFDKQSVDYLVEEFCGGLESRTNHYPASAKTKMLVTLRYLASNALQEVIGDTFCISKGGVNNIIWEVIPRIAERMDDFIKMPTGQALLDTNRDFHRMTGIPGIVGCIDCTHIKVNVGEDQKASFLNRKGFTSNNVQAVCDASYRFISVYAFWPGCTHDSFILKHSALFKDFEQKRREGILLGDSGYGSGKPWMLTPFGNPETPAQRRYNYAQKRGRVLIEQSFGQVKRRFRGLLDGFRTSPERANIATVAAMVLHNIAKERGQPDNFDDAQPGDLEMEEECTLPATAGAEFPEGRRFRDHIVETFFV